VEQVIDLIVTAVSKIECINAPGLRQLHVDLDYVVNCCRWVDEGLRHVPCDVYLCMRCVMLPQRCEHQRRAPQAVAGPIAGYFAATEQ
jgi:hypothetical protein